MSPAGLVVRRVAVNWCGPFGYGRAAAKSVNGHKVEPGRIPMPATTKNNIVKRGTLCPGV